MAKLVTIFYDTCVQSNLMNKWFVKDALKKWKKDKSLRIKGFIVTYKKD